MKKQCLACSVSIVGRADKRFCSVTCKNNFNNTLRKRTHSEVQEVIGYLLRNRELLATLMGESVKETFDRLVLTRAGFRWEYHTSTYLNKEGKTYHLVFDYAWMEFSDQKVLVIRKKGK
jgi:predicted nucleic acid-binding Zn ribbon protein